MLVLVTWIGGKTPVPLTAEVTVEASENEIVNVPISAPADVGVNATSSAQVEPSGTVGFVSQLVPLLPAERVKSRLSMLTPVTVTSAPLVFVNVSVVGAADWLMMTLPKSKGFG